MADPKMVTLGVVDYRTDYFDADVEGVAPIASVARGGTDVPEKNVDEVMEAGKNAGVKIKKMS